MSKERNESLTVGTTAVVVSKDKENSLLRENITIINTSTGGQIITLSLDKDAVAGEGIPLSPGGTFSDSLSANYKPSQKMISAISSASGGTISIQERLGAKQ
jgi:hypothetical protein